MQQFLSAVAPHVDYVVFCALMLSLCAFLYLRFWRGHRFAVVGLLVTLGLLVGGWFVVEAAGKRERLRMQQMVEGFAPTYARELERLGHASITLDTPADDPRYLEMIEAEKRWLTANPTVNDIYTMRKMDDGRIHLIVDSETDYDRDGKIDGEREVRTAIGELYEEEFRALERVYETRQPHFEDEIYTDRWGTWVSSAVPMFAPDGSVEAVVGVDFAAARWLTAIRRARLTTIGYMAALALVVAGLSGATSHRMAMRDLESQRAAQAALELEKRKLETLVNSIDGIVWEFDIPKDRFTFVSQQCERILGYKAEEWTKSPTFWNERLHPEDEWACEQCDKMVARRRPYHFDYRLIAADGRTVWIRESAATLCDDAGNPVLVRGVFRDITEQKAAAEELESTHRALMDSSRQAGMAEVATGVLHNVGNVLNSVNVSGNVVDDRLQRSKIEDLRKIAGLLADHKERFAEFVANDPRGKFVPDLVMRVTDALATEQAEIGAEMRAILKNINHIKEIVAMQQSYAKVGGVLEPLEVQELVEDALRINAASLNRHEVDVERSFAAVPRVLVDKHRVLQILVNLIRNAKQAMDDAPASKKVLTLSVSQTSEDRVRISVTDTGTGIAPENLTRIFNHGFTTKKTGHGFGLHSGALSASEMGGALTVQSDGPGKGATFTLELPVVLAPAARNSLQQAA